MATKDLVNEGKITNGQTDISVKDTTVNGELELGSSGDLGTNLIDAINSNVTGFVHVMDAPSSATLTDEQIAQFHEGVFLNGTFLGYKNPIILPWWDDESHGRYNGVVIGNGSTSNNPTFEIRGYEIRKSNKVLAWTSAKWLTTVPGWYAAIDCRTVKAHLLYANYFSRGNVNKVIPDFPSDTGTFTLKMVNGTLTWVEDV